MAISPYAQAGVGVAGGLMASNPWTAGIMAAGSVAGQMMGTPDPSNTAISGSGMFDQHFDGSGWVVATGGSDARALPTVTSALQSTAGQALGLLQNPMVLIAAAVIALAYFRSR
ncbi:hypothetical protein [Cupriavidus sp.]|uniref:hypothetical protein n=1 Tax=Cupriavidus sp. TaxID=1873897 RepID=UPI0028BF0AD0|nr:hypothetical protein [Cupriavidus sp.]